MNKSNRNVTLIMISVVAAICVTGVYALVPSTTPAQTLTSDNAKMLGHIELVLTDPDGKVKAYRQTDNLIVNTGLNSAADLLFGTTLATGEFAGGFTIIGVGTSPTSSTASNTVLGGQVGTRKSNVGGVTSGGNGVASIAATWTAGHITNGSALSVTEAGLFDQYGGGAGNMFARQTFAAISVGSADTLTVTWTITFADSDTT